MDWMTCSSCGARYLPTELGCPNCPGAARLQSAKARALEAERSAAPPRRDPWLAALHLAFAASILWTVVSFGRPLWALGVAALELAVAVAALARWRSLSFLAVARAGVYAGGATLLFWVEIGGPGLWLVLLGHAAAVLAARSAAGAGAPFLGGAFAGVQSTAPTGEEVAARRRASGDVQFFARGVAFLVAVLSWVQLVAVLRDVARAG